MEIRRAAIGDREELLAMLNCAFSREGEQSFDFAASHPHLFTDERVGNHVVAVRDDRIVGAIGAYPYTIRNRGVEFKAAGIGQVACHPDYRRQGVMTSILKVLDVSLRDSGIDFSWLYGDRQRYGRYGWTKGGSIRNLSFMDKYLDKVVLSGEIESLDCAKDSNWIRQRINALNDVTVLDDASWDAVLEVDGIGVDRLNNAFIYYQRHGDCICAADGSEEELTELITYRLAENKKREGDNWKIAVDCPCWDSPMLRVASRYYWQETVSPAAMFRVENPLPLMEKIINIAGPALNAGDGVLALLNKDTGQSITIHCDGGQLRVEQAADDGISLTTRQLSDVFFGRLALQTYLPGIPTDTVFQQFLPFPLYVSHLLPV